MAEFVPVARVGDVPDPGKTTLDVDDRLVVLIHAGGSWYCLDDVCTHDGGPLGEQHPTIGIDKGTGSNKNESDTHGPSLDGRLCGVKANSTQL